MAKYSDVINGLRLFWDLEGDVHGVCAGHDIIYAGPDTSSDVAAEKVAQLEAWGWHIDSESGRWARFV